MLGTLKWFYEQYRDWKSTKEAKAEKKALDSHKEIKTLFSKIHEEYKKNFMDYLDCFENDADTNNIINRISSLNKLTADDRAELLRLAKIRANPSEDETYQLLLEYFGAADSDNMYAEFDKENIVYQRWRTGIKDDIQSILAEDWQALFDPGASRPPLSEMEINQEKEQRWQTLKRPGDSELDLDKLKKYLILDSINTKLESCQRLAIQINASLDNLKPD